MEKKEFIRSSKDAFAFLKRVFSKVILCNQLLEEQIKLKKIRVDDDTQTYIIVWCLKEFKDIYVGVTTGGGIIVFDASRIRNWLPYKGETIAPNQFLLFDLNGKPYIETLLIPDGNEALQILLEKFPLAQGSIHLISSYQFCDGNRSKRLEYLWAMRMDLHYYQAISPFTGKFLLIRNYGDDLKRIFHPGDDVGDIYTLAEDVDGNLKLKRR